MCQRLSVDREIGEKRKLAAGNHVESFRFAVLIQPGAPVRRLRSKWPFAVVRHRFLVPPPLWLSLLIQVLLLLQPRYSSCILRAQT